MDNRFFSLLIVPDSGKEVKTGSFNFRFILGFFSILVITFFVCLFFIIGYHIKLSQENNYKSAVLTNKYLISHIEKSAKLFNTLSEKLSKIQRNDRAFRLHENIDILDDEMYKAGIGGHVIINDSEYSTLTEDLQVELKKLDYGVTTLNHRIVVQENSLREIQSKVKHNIEEIDNTPSIPPALSIRVTSSYGPRRHPITGIRHFHNAVDLGGYRGQPIFATADGIVKFTGRQGRLGNCVKIQHKYGYETLYGHLNKIQVKVGQKVMKRDIIGFMGSSGRTTGIHVHYAVSLNRRSQNPMKYFY